jgi:4-carboxymuconolactone decarboxylase
MVANDSDAAVGPGRLRAHGRLPYPDLDRAPEAVREALRALPLLNIFRMLAYAETALRPCLRLGGTILGRLELDPKLRELAILEVAARTEARYEWVQHVSIGRHVGLSDEQIGALESRETRQSAALSDAERAVVAFAAEVVAGPRVSDATFDAAGRWLSPRAIVELLLTIGNYMMLARVMTTLELDLDDPAGEQVLGVGGRE